MEINQAVEVGRGDRRVLSSDVVLECVLPAVEITAQSAPELDLRS